MKKNIAAKSIRRYAAALTLAVVVLMLAIPYAQAKYTSKALFEVESGVFEEEIDTGISGVSSSDLDALLTMLLDERFPPGSIYMTTVEDGHPNVGSWALYAEGKVPVGVNPASEAGYDTTAITVDSLSANIANAGQTGGSLGGGANNAIVTLPSGTSLGTLAVEPGSVTLTYDLSAAAYSAGRVNLTGPNIVNSNAIGLDSNHLPAHKHDADIYAKHASHYQACIGPGNYTYSGVRTGGNTTNNEQYASIGNRGKGDGFSVPYGSFPWADLYGTFSGVSATVTAPTVGYIQQAFTGPATISGDQSATVADNTVQPYEVCFIYQRIS